MARQLRMRADEPPFCEVITRASEALKLIADHLCNGRIDPAVRLRACRAESTPPRSNGPLRLGVFPTAGNPLHWGHLLCVLEAVAELRLDRVALLIQGVDARKPLASDTEYDRHGLAQQAVALLEPLAVYSDVGHGNDGVGEQNVFRLLRLNPDVEIVAHYLVGADHYRLTDARGRPDTLPRLVANMADPVYGFDPTMHRLEVAFVERGMRGPPVPTELPVRFIRKTLEGSSTAVRAGEFALVPHLVLRYLAQHPDYAEAIGLASAHAMTTGRVDGDTHLRVALPAA